MTTTFERLGLTVAAMAAIGAVAFVAYGGGFPNTDASWTLVWGRELLHLQTPSFAEGATPHPLTNVLGVIAAALHPASETVLQVAGYAAVGGLVTGVFALGRSLFGVAVGVLAAALVATRDTLLFYGALAYVDVIFAALVVWAIALEAARPRRGVPVLALLAVAGLARPEAWLLAGAYWLYARPADRREALRWAVLVVAPPLLWLAIDLLLTGDPLFSFTATTEATDRSGRPTGLDGLLTEGPRILARTARPEVCLAALAGLAVAWRAGHLKLLGGALVASALATAVPVLAGTPLNDRYLMVDDGAAVRGCRRPARRGPDPASESRLWRFAGAGLSARAGDRRGRPGAAVHRAARLGRRPRHPPQRRARGAAPGHPVPPARRAQHSLHPRRRELARRSGSATSATAVRACRPARTCGGRRPR